LGGRSQVAPAPPSPEATALFEVAVDPAAVQAVPQITPTPAELPEIDALPAQAAPIVPIQCGEWS